jgi:phosphohistidine phosphatase SixA
MELIVVRHAHAGSRRDWPGDDISRPLTQRGRDEADRIALQFCQHLTTRLVSSPRLRCLQTLEPLAAKLGTEVTVDQRLDEQPCTADLLALIDEFADAPTMISTHGDVVPEVLRVLRDERGLSIVDPLNWPKASAWVISRNADGSFDTATFFGPPNR